MWLCTVLEFINSFFVFRSKWWSWGYKWPSQYKWRRFWFQWIWRFWWFRAKNPRICGSCWKYWLWLWAEGTWKYWRILEYSEIYLGSSVDLDGLKIFYRYCYSLILALIQQSQIQMMQLRNVPAFFVIFWKILSQMCRVKLMMLEIEKMRLILLKVKTDLTLTTPLTLKR